MADVEAGRSKLKPRRLYVCEYVALLSGVQQSRYYCQGSAITSANLAFERRDVFDVYREHCVA